MCEEDGGELERKRDGGREREREREWGKVERGKGGRGVEDVLVAYLLLMVYACPAHCLLRRSS